jgi:hypothetical protein
MRRGALGFQAGDAKKCTGSAQDCLNHMAKNLNNRGWVGIEMDDKGGAGMMIVTKVIDRSPAQKVGFFSSQPLTVPSLSESLSGSMSPRRGFSQ